MALPVGSSPAFTLSVGDGAVDKVDAGAAGVGFAVDGGAGFNIVGYIGDVYAHLHVAVGQRLEREGIVVVLCIFGVDGESGDGAEVLSAFIIFLGRREDVLGLFLGLWREVEREVVFGEDGLHLHVVVARAAEPFDDASHGVVHALWPVGHLHQGFLAVGGSGQFVERDEDVHNHRTAVAHQEGKAVLPLNDSDETGAGAM